MKEKVIAYINEFNMLREGDAVVAGVSGGADSVCLLLILSELSREIGFSLSAVHVEHGIRGEESRGDAEFTEQLCRSLDVPFVLFTVDVPKYRDEAGLSLEEAARDLRYDCFREACERTGADRIALAHNADDCAGTMLFNLARGTGIRGMSGIRPVSERSFGAQKTGGRTEDLIVIRPLLCAARAEIEAWLAERGQAYRIDSTNSDITYARNRIRERVLPELSEVNTQAVPHMRQLSEQLAGISDYMDEAALEAGRGAFSIDAETEGPADAETEGPAAHCAVTIRCVPFKEMHPVLQRHLLLYLIGIAAGGRKDITSLHVERVLCLMTSDAGTQVQLPGGVTAEKTYDSVVLRGKSDDAPVDYTPVSEKDLLIPGETFLENGLHFSTKIIDFTDFSKKIPLKSYTKWFDYDKINSAVQLRTRRGGDYLQTGREGEHKKLQRFFIDEKVPRRERDRICLLADGDHIIWIVGFRISEAYKVTEDTRRVLCVSVEGPGISEREDTDG